MLHWIRETKVAMQTCNRLELWKYWLSSLWNDSADSFIYIWIVSYVCQFSSISQPCPTDYDYDFATPWTAARQASCPSPTPGVYSNPCPLSQWCHPAISSSVVPFSSCPQSFPASGSFQMSQFFTSGGQRIGVSASASVLPRNIQSWSPLGWTGWISLQSKGISRVLSNTTVQKINSSSAQLSL